MTQQEKPYRLYRGGRVRGRVPLSRHDRRAGATGTAPSPSRPRRIRWWRWVAVTVAAVLLLGVGWGVASWLSFSSGMEDANARVPEGALSELTAQEGLLTGTPTTILVLGVDGAKTGGREGANRSDSIMLLRTDPGKGRVAFLSIPRDLRVEIPGRGTAKINAAMQWGGPALALKAVKGLTGLDVNHLAVVDFDTFKEVIDAVGGIEVDVPKPILSNRFDCPYATDAECREWPGWRFEKGRQKMDGRRALVYARVRENRLDPGETDFQRGRRQQQVLEATADKLTSFGTAARLPFIASDVVQPLASDLSAGEVLQLGWAWFRADTKRALHCRLGGDPATVGGESVILGSEDNVATVAMFVGRSAPLPPAKGVAYAPGCLVGSRLG